MLARSFSLLVVGGAILLASVSSCGPTKPPASESGLDQNWNANTQSLWYWTSQGSRLVPLAWFNALEQAGSEQLFRERSHLESFKYVFSGAVNAPARPIGFAVDDQRDDKLTVTKLRWKSQQGNREPWVGLTCAACHTAELTFKGTAIRIDGGPTFADFQSFIEALNASLAATASSDEKFERFAARVLGDQPSAADKSLLRTALSSLTQWQLDLAAMNQTPLRYGYGRLDAFGHIFNKVARVAAGSQVSGNPPDAPVSYPFLWNVPQLDKVQWNGIAKNEAVKLPLTGKSFELDALGRNTGEVIGVFADVKATPGVSLGGYTSSVQVTNLDLLEESLKSLRPPRWPSETFGEIKADLEAQGKVLFGQHCQACHEFLDRKNLSREIKTRNVRLVQVGGVAPIGTDPWMACNAYLYEANAGVLAGTPSKYVSGDPLESRAGVAEMLGVMVAGTLVGEKGDVIRAALRSFFGVKRVPSIAFSIEGPAPSARAMALTQCRLAARNVDILGYQSRPLTGIWATAPYLHNGSVPTLYDLLLPPAQRPATFYVGSREFDPAKVGLAQPQDGTGLFKFEVKNPDGSEKPGNSNAGHDYGSATLSEAQRQALVEYMKSL